MLCLRHVCLMHSFSILHVQRDLSISGVLPVLTTIYAMRDASMWAPFVDGRVGLFFQINVL